MDWLEIDGDQNQHPVPVDLDETDQQAHTIYFHQIILPNQNHSSLRVALSDVRIKMKRFHLQVPMSPLLLRDIYLGLKLHSRVLLDLFN